MSAVVELEHNNYVLWTSLASTVTLASLYYVFRVAQVFGISSIMRQQSLIRLKQEAGLAICSVFALIIVTITSDSDYSPSYS